MHTNLAFVLWKQNTFVISYPEMVSNDNKKGTCISCINKPQNVRQLRKFLGMVQYYRDIWARRSEMLAPITNLVGECGHTKVTKAKKTKKVPWH